MNNLFLDTGYLIALESSNDQYHEMAQAHWHELRANLPPIVTTSFVLDEVATFFNCRGFHSKAVAIAQGLLDSPATRIVHVDEELFSRSWAYFKTHNDKRYSFTDCVSFVVMTELEIEKALSFDKHFTQAGFHTEPN